MQLAASRPVFARYRGLWPAAYWLITAIGAVWVFGIVYGIVPYGYCGNLDMVPCDAYAFWAADSTPYTWETNLEYRYSPAFLWIVAPFQALPFEVFLGAWTAAHVAALAWLRAGWFLVVPGLNEDVLRGNISTFLALIAVLAIQRTAAWWAPALLTKITPAVGLIWHLVRGEWRGVAACFAVTLGITVVGYVLAPGLWNAWFQSLASSGQTYEIGHPLGPVWLRAGIAAAIVAFAAWSSRAWLVPVAMFLAVPGLWAFNWGLLAGIPRLISERREAEPGADDAG